MSFRLILPHLAPNQADEFQPNAEWATLRAKYEAIYPDWTAFYGKAARRYGSHIRQNWPLHRPAVIKFFAAISRASKILDALPGRARDYWAVGGQHMKAFAENIQQLTYKSVLLASMALSDAVPLQQRPDSRFVLWGKVALSLQGACFARAAMRDALKLLRDAERQQAELERRIATMQKGIQAARQAPKSAPRA